MALPDETTVGAAPDVARRMRERGVAVRAWARLPVVGGALRIGAGPWAVMARVLDALPRPGGAARQAGAAS
jgi:hypothetical protein